MKATQAIWVMACIVLALGGVALTAGCGAPDHPSSHAPDAAHPNPAVSRMSGRVRTETAQSTQSLSLGAAQEHAGALVQLGAAFVACHLGSAELRYSRTIAVRPGQRISVPAMATRIVAAMRAAGWRVRSVDMADMHIPAGAAPHPLYYFSRAPTTGAANVIPYNETGAEALVIINSPCFNAGPLSKTLQRQGR
jgi:hypothetical protein